MSLEFSEFAKQENPGRLSSKPVRLHMRTQSRPGTRPPVVPGTARAPAFFMFVLAAYPLLVFDTIMALFFMAPRTLPQNNTTTSEVGCWGGQRRFSESIQSDMLASHRGLSQTRGATDRVQSPTEAKLCGSFNSSNDVPGQKQAPLEARI